MYLYGIATGEEEALFLLLTVLFWVAVVGGVGAALRFKARGRRARTPEDVLFQRFVAGEIDDDEYRHDREVLRGVPHLCGRDGS
ncbi:SHOCT domain-containing protein [Planotetraspora mira]|uniref:SHOCT domain-containing protein n=1 Tax=Planotetraspora mira TaxID=58121 RepID=A0A8J3U8A6_9ACTN|nr:hypothetical protein [Planotetraspora mira]GII34395.1 hypothetical protein Pmi06nite_78370 [Planotetraspora mira]